MDRIYAKAQRKKRNRDLDEILAMLDDLKDEDFQISKQKILARLDEMIAENEVHPSETVETGNGWDFSREKAQSIFAEDDIVQLRPFSKGDERFYFLIREQYKIFEKDLSEEQLISSYWVETQQDSAFYCTIVRSRDCTKLGYIALKNTSKNLWEIAIELGQEYCRCGYGARAILLFLRKVREITGKSVFQFLVEIDNIPCQGCMKKIEARLVGIHNLVFDTEEEAKQFEEENLELITEHMQMLAKELDVAPKELLSHVLDYRLDLL